MVGDSLAHPGRVEPERQQFGAMCVNGSAGAIGVETSLVQELRLALDYDGVSEFYGIGTEPASLQFTTLGTAQVSQNAPDAREKRGGKKRRRL